MQIRNGKIFKGKAVSPSSSSIATSRDKTFVRVSTKLCKTELRLRTGRRGAVGRCDFQNVNTEPRNKKKWEEGRTFQEGLDGMAVSVSWLGSERNSDTSVRGRVSSVWRLVGVNHWRTEDLRGPWSEEMKVVGWNARRLFWLMKTPGAPLSFSGLNVHDTYFDTLLLK